MNAVLVGTEFEKDHECEARDTFQFVLEFVARRFQTLFIMRQEQFKNYKTSGINPSRYFALIKVFCSSGFGCKLHLIETGCYLSFLGIE